MNSVQFICSEVSSLCSADIQSSSAWILGLAHPRNLETRDSDSPTQNTSSIDWTPFFVHSSFLVMFTRTRCQALDSTPRRFQIGATQSRAARCKTSPRPCNRFQVCRDLRAEAGSHAT